MKRKTFLLSGFLFFYASTHAQMDDRKEMFTVDAGAGIMTFNGDIGKKSIQGNLSRVRSGYSIALSKPVKKNIYIDLNFVKGKVARDEKSVAILPKLNFESPITQLGVGGTFLIQNKKKYSVVPFISAGIALTFFHPYTDLLDNNGNPYYYWLDGSIHELPESPRNFYAPLSKRDYKYETELSGKQTAIALPLSGGIKFKLTESFDANLKLSYNMAFTDKIDK